MLINNVSWRDYTFLKSYQTVPGQAYVPDVRTILASLASLKGLAPGTELPRLVRKDSRQIICYSHISGMLMQTLDYQNYFCSNNASLHKTTAIL